MPSTALRNVLGHRLRLLTTGLAVALGVAFMAGTLVFTDTMSHTFDEMFAGAYAKTDALVRAESTFEANGFEQRPRIDESILSLVAQLDGVAEAQGDTWGYAQVVGRDGEPIGMPGAGPPTVGANWSEAALNTWTLETGRGPKAEDEVVLDKGVADEGGYVVGDRATVLVQGAPLEVTVTGIATFQGADSPGGASFVMFTTEAAQAHVGEPGKVDSVSLSAMPDVSEEELAAEVRTVLPSGLEVITGEEYTEENQDAMASALAFFDQFMLVFAVVALLVGGFIIFNTFFITVAQRTRQHALLRAVGASRRQVLASILVEALIVGLVASLVGLVGGIGVAVGLKALLAAFGLDLPASGLVLATGSGLTAFAAGLVVTLLAAIAPARRAGRVPPVAAMRELDAPPTGRQSATRVGAGASLLGAGVAAMLYGLWGRPSNALGAVGLGALGVFFGMAVLARTFARPLSAAIGAALPHLRGMPGQLARENAMRNPQRTAATASALMIGVGLVSFITIFAASTKTSFSQVVDRTFTGDVIITPAASQPGGSGLAPELARELRNLPEVRTAAGIRAGVVEVEGEVNQILAADAETFELFDIDPISGSAAELDADSIAVHDEVAEEEGVAVGDEVVVSFPHTGDQVMRVALVYGEQQPAGRWLLGTDAYEANFPAANQVDFQVFVGRSDGTAPEDLVAAVEEIAAEYPGARVLDQSEYKEQQLAFVDQLLGLMYALLGLAILIALLGIGNTLALSIIERTRELGLLRAVGMTRSQLRSMVRWESVVIAVQGAVLGLGIGVFFGWAIVAALEDQGLTTLAVPVTSLAAVVVIAALAGVLAGLLPARRAARMDVLRAVVST